MGTIGRRTRAALLTAVVAATTAVGAGGGVPASAQSSPGYTVTVTPSSGVGDGDEVAVTTTGLNGSYLFGVLQCDASALDDLPSGFSGPCAIRSIQSGSGTEDTATIVLSGAFVASNGDTVRCGVEPGDCAVVSWSPFGWQAGVAIDMSPTPAVPARRSQEVGFPVDVIVTAPPTTTGAQLAQCVLPVGPDLASSQCSPAQPVTLDSGGFATVPLTVAASVGEPAHHCGDGDCGVALFDGAGTALGDGSPLGVLPEDGPPQMSSHGTVEANDGAFINVDVTHILNESVDVAQCDAAVAATEDVVGGPCTPASHWDATPDATGTSFYLQLRKAFTGTDGSEVTCADDDDCVLALKGSSGAFSTVPITWNVPDVVVASPSSGVLDGQVLTVDASGLTPGDAYAVMRCSSSALTEYCETSPADAPTVTASAEGTIETTVIAAQRFTRTDGTPEVCRDDCIVALHRTSVGSASVAYYTMAPGTLGAAPATGLQDGQPVEVSWTGTQPSYEGPLWWILQTGAWALGQCGAGILDDTSVANVFRQCITPPGGGAVTVTDPDGGADVEVQATIQPPIGGPIDCTTGPEACVAVLVRVEQDASVTLLSSPLTFA